jgi:hypothetical protein
MSNLTRAMMMGAAGAAESDPVYVDEVFSTYLYDGTGNAQTITNGIDLNGKGGLVWIKNRTGTNSHLLYDTERGVNKYIGSNLTAAEYYDANQLTAFGTNGFTVGTQSYINSSSHDFASWTFRKAPGFFDVVTYAGNSTAGRQIPHSLGSVPGMIIIKATNKTSLWRCYHRSLPSANYVINLNETAAATDSGTAFWNSTAPTASVFTLGASGNVNETNSTYVAYIFAHDDASFGTNRNESIIKCGTYTGNGSATGPVINLGFEPQWVILKPSSGSGQWQVYDTMRGWTDGGKDILLYANLSNAEDDTNTDMIKPFSTGFQLTANFTGNSSGVTYIYMAIRRPHKPPTAGTDVFAMDTGSGSLVDGVAFTSGFPVDAALTIERSATDPNYFLSRLMGNGNYLNTAQTSAVASGMSYGTFDHMTGWYSTGSANQSWMFKRAPGFMDVVAYKGSSSTVNTQNHNLSAVPELIITKIRSGGTESGVGGWGVYAAPVGSAKVLQLNTSASAVNDSWFSATPTTSTFQVYGNDPHSNRTNGNYVALLFATLPGISKVGSYTGTAATQNIDCGFTNGARFVMIKRTDGTGNWMVFDSTRGIVSGNDPKLHLNETNAETTGTDYIDPYNAGFTLTSENDTNGDSDEYIFLAIA